MRKALKTALCFALPVVLAMTIDSCLSANAPIITIKEDVLYSTPGGFNLYLNLAFQKDAARPLPALIFLPGNGWGYWWDSSFDRRQYSDDIKKAAAMGYVAVAADYRPTSIKEAGKPKYQFPDQLIDVRRAVRWLRAHASTYKIDPTRIGALGWSSGGHLSLMLGLIGPIAKYPDESGDESFSSTVQAVVSIGGPTELSRMYTETTYDAGRNRLVDLLGGKPEEIPDKYRAASPLYYVSKSASPVLMIQGDSDEEVPPNQATLFVDKGRAQGARIELVLLKATGHVNATNTKEIYPFLDGILKTGK